ncbi:MAG: hypothetical protein RL377_530, partial [Bacteroidota bacterium]
SLRFQKIPYFCRPFTGSGMVTAIERGKKN